MKFNLIYFTLILFLLTSCYNQERNCKDFKTGKFSAEITIDGKKQLATFERNDSLQIETFNGKTDTSSVRWVNDCEYITQKMHPKSMKEKKAVSLRILTTKGNAYTYEYSFVGESKKQTGTVTKIN